MTKKPSFWQAIRRSSCPHCRQGAIFESFMKMYERCAVCGIKYEREHGYFLMAIFVGYMLNGILFAPIALYFYFTDRLEQLVIPLVIAVLLLAPLTFRYSRVVWLHIDEVLDPHRPDEG